MTKAELIETAYEMTGGNVEDMSLDQLHRLITVALYVSDIALNEIERRGALTFNEGVPVVPYICDYMVKTVLTR